MCNDEVGLAHLPEAFTVGDIRNFPVMCVCFNCSVLSVFLVVISVRFNFCMF